MRVIKVSKASDFVKIIVTELSSLFSPDDHEHEKGPDEDDNRVTINELVAQ